MHPLWKQKLYTVVCLPHKFPSGCARSKSAEVRKRRRRP